MVNPIPPGTIICSNCKKRPATIKWVGPATNTDVIHGAPIELWCKICTINAQLEYLKEQIKLIPIREAELKTELKELLKRESVIK